MNKKIIVGIFVAVAVAAAGIAAIVTKKGPIMPPKEPKAAETVPTQLTSTPSITAEPAKPEPALEVNAEATIAVKGVKEFTITAKTWEFVPNTIAVNKGDTVRLKITSVDVAHGFNLADFNVNVTLDPGETQVVEFVANKTGTFSFYCSVFCGEGHSQMRGELVVR